MVDKQECSEDFQTLFERWKLDFLEFDYVKLDEIEG